jgi:hypothetical protein
MPLRVGEILQAAAFLRFSWHDFFLWIARTPAGAPLHYLTQLPLAMVSPNSRILLRLPSLICTVGSAFLFFALTKRVGLQHRILSFVLFLIVPTHLLCATQARPYELGLFLLLLASLFFFSLIDNPGLTKALMYAITLTACLYTQPSCYLPAIGHLIYLLGFANLQKYRRALWFVLIATLLPLIAYAPYYIWAGAHRQGDFLIEQFPSYTVKVVGVQAFMSLDPEVWTPWFGIGLLGLLLLGLVGGIASTAPLRSHFEGGPQQATLLLQRRATVFCLAGGAMVTLLVETAFCGLAAIPFAPYQALWALPGLIVAFCAALDAMLRVPVLKGLTLLNPLILSIAILLCLPGGVEYLRTEPVDMEKLTAMVRPQISSDACVVFVSQHFSKYLFEVFAPDLTKYECQNFFHKRVVLAIHPFVKPEQEREARIFFRGLDFEETHRNVLGDGKVITMDARR